MASRGINRGGGTLSCKYTCSLHLSMWVGMCMLVCMRVRVVSLCCLPVPAVFACVQQPPLPPSAPSHTPSLAPHTSHTFPSHIQSHFPAHTLSHRHPSASHTLSGSHLPVALPSPASPRPVRASDVLVTIAARQHLGLGVRRWRMRLLRLRVAWRLVRFVWRFHVLSSARGPRSARTRWSTRASRTMPAQLLLDARDPGPAAPGGPFFLLFFTLERP